MYVLVAGFLLNFYVVFTEPTNRNQRRQQAKIGSYRT